jgi:hypothetical protein
MPPSPSVLTPFDRRRKEIACGANERRRTALEAEVQVFATDEPLIRLSQAQEQLAHWQDKDWRDPALVRDTAEFHRAVRAAFRSGHTDHPIVLEWLAGRRSLGDRSELRKLRNARSGLTAAVSKPLSFADFWLLDILEGLPSNSHPSVIRRDATAKIRQNNWLPDWMQHVVMPNERSELRAELRSRVGATRQAFEKWLGKLGIAERRARRRIRKQ